MGKNLLRRPRWILGLAAWVGLGWLTASPSIAQNPYAPTSAPKTSFTDSIKQGFSKVGGYLVPSKPKSENKPTVADDPISLKSKSKPGPELYSAIARLYEESGKNAEAEQYYQMALKEKADDLPSLLGYARFQENQGRINEAVALYQKAVQTHPKEPGVYNNLGLCYARRGKQNEATQALGQAVQLEPRNVLYRNNLATVLVDQNRLPEALAALRDVHGEAKACYNMGYLLNKKGKTEAAEHYFAQALRADPTMAPAQRWLNYLHDKSREQAGSVRANDGPIQVSGMPNTSRFPAKVITPSTSTPSTSAGFSSVEKGAATGPQTNTPPMPPVINSTQRLPPISSRQPGVYPEPQGGAENSVGPNLSDSPAARPAINGHLKQDGDVAFIIKKAASLFFCSHCNNVSR